MKVFCTLALVGATAAGCVTVDPRARFPAVEQTVAQRTQQRVHWNTGTPADDAVRAQVDRLLTQSLTADAAAQIALLNNRHLQATYEDLGVAQADLVQAGLLRNPVFDGSIHFFEANSHSPKLDLGIAFNFLDLFFVGLRKNLAAAQLDAAEARVTAAVLDLAAQTRVAFYDVQAAQQAVDLLQQAQTATAASAELAKRLRDAGNIRPIDLANQQAAHGEARLALAQAQTDLTQSRERLNRLMGVTTDTWSIRDRLLEPPAIPTTQPTDLETRAIEASLDLRERRAAVNVARRELGITRPFGVLSDLEVGASSERDDGEWEVGPAISTPLPIFSQGQPAVARAQAQLRQAEQDYVATAVDVRSHVRAMAARVQALRTQLEQYRTGLLPLREQIVHETQLQFNAMQVGGFELLQAKRQQIDGQRSYVELLRDYWIARAQLELILSGRMPATADEGAN